jgi:predicted aconitase
VLGARCNRNSGILELFGSVVGYVPYFGLLTDEGRKATWVVEIKTTKKPEAQILGSAIGMKVMEDVPYVKGLTKFIGTELNADATAYLKDFGAATASNGAVGLYHIEGLTPEAVELGEKLIADGAQTYVIDDAELERVKKSYPCIWKDPNATPKLCFVGCPHLSIKQLHDWTNALSEALAKQGKKKVAIPTVFTSALAVQAEFEKTPDYQKLLDMGVVLSYICPLMYMNNPLCGKQPVITNSNKLRTYTSARYHTDAEILDILSKGGN